MKRGPGVFVYEGGHKSVEEHPTVKTRDKHEPVVDEDGAVKVDANGRVQTRQVGKQIVMDHNGMPMLGGKPKRKLITHDTFSLPGWTAEGEDVQVFEQNVPQQVTNAALALKLRCHGACRELEGAELEAWLAREASEAEAPKAKRGRPRKSDADGVDAS
jgi:hypothetical protein